MFVIDSWYEAPRFFVSPDDLTLTSPNPSAVVTGDEAHHALRVMRLKNGDAVVLLDGSGREYYGHIGSVDPDRKAPSFSVEHMTQRQAPTEPPFPIHLVQGLPKGDKLEFVMQKATEVGVTSFWPVQTERVVVSYRGDKARSKQMRWQRIAAEAAKQSRRGIAPVVHPVGPLVDVAMKLSQQGSRILLFWEKATRPLQHVADGWKREGKLPDSGGGLSLVVGPEGGLTEKEVSALMDMGAEVVSLGPRILRTETAGIVIPALALFALSDG